MSGCPGWSHPCAALPAPRPRSPALPDVWRWQPGRFRIPDPSPQPRGRYITGADATHPAACHSLREARTGAAGGGGPRRPGGGRHRHRHPAGPGGRGSGGGGGAEPAARARPLRPGPAGTPAARSPCTVGTGEGRAGRAGTAAGRAAARGSAGVADSGGGGWSGGRPEEHPVSRGTGRVPLSGRSGARRRCRETLRGGGHRRMGGSEPGCCPRTPRRAGAGGAGLGAAAAPRSCGRRGRPPPLLGRRCLPPFTCRLGAQVRSAGPRGC